MLRGKVKRSPGGPPLRLSGRRSAPGTFAVHFDDRVVDESVHRGRGHGGVRENGVPGRKRLICGDGDAVAFVSMRDDLNRTLVSA